MITPTPVQTAPSGPFNNGQPLNPQQIQSMRSQFNIKPTAGNSSAGSNGDPWTKFDQLNGGQAKQQSSSPSYLSQVGSNLSDTFSGGAKSVMSDIGNAPKLAEDAGGGVVPTVASALSTAGHVAGDIAGTAGGIIGSLISPVLPDSIKSKIGDVGNYITQKMNSAGIPPEVQKSLGDIFNTLSLEGGAKAEPAIGDAAGAVKNAASDAIGGTKDAVTGTTGKISDGLLNIADNVHNTVPENVKTALNNSSLATQNESLLQKYFDAGRTAVSKTGAPTPIDIAGKEQVSKALGILKQQMTGAGEDLNSALNEAGSKTVDSVSPILKDLHDTMMKRTGATYNPYTENIPIAKGMSPEDSVKALESAMSGKSTIEGINEPFSSVAGRTNTLDSTEMKKLGGMFEGLMNLQAEPTVQKVNDFVDKMQSDLYKSKLPGASPINDKVTAMMKSTLGKLNTAAKKAGGETYTNANSSYSIARTLHDTLSKAVGANYNKAGSLMKRIFSPQDGGVKTFMGQVEKQTGVPIFHHATLAKFAMDTLKDPRSASLLDSIKKAGSGGTTMLGIAKSLLEHGAQKIFGGPEQQALRTARRSVLKVGK